MRHLTDLDSRENAENFVAYLITIGVSTHVEQESGVPSRWSVWIKEEDKLSLARSELDAFRADPANPKYAQSKARANAILEEQRALQKQREKNLKQIRSTSSTMSSARLNNRAMPPVTLGLIVVCVIFGFLTGFGRANQNDKLGWTIMSNFRFVDFKLFDETGDPAASLKKFEIWRIFTPALLHGNAIHLLVNMLSLASLGRLAERLEGKGKYIAIMLICALGAHLLQGLMPPTILGMKAIGGTPFFVGISGVVMGLFGYLAVKTKIRSDLGIYFPPDSYFMVGFIIVVGLIGAMPFANLAHIGGLLTGAILGYFWNR
ncbi:MAG: rhomboid family intramembrane serine protease [Pirellula sp.]|nr:rhomboid family intramembrane serine protease [Pirellula sp.]